MSHTTYQSFVLVPEGHPLTRAILFENIRQRFSARDNVTIEIDSDQTLKIKKGTWTLYVNWDDDSHVLEESQEMAVRFLPEGADREEASSCAIRITTHANPNPKMNTSTITYLCLKYLIVFLGSSFLRLLPKKCERRKLFHLTIAPKAASGTMPHNEINAGENLCRHSKNAFCRKAKTSAAASSK